MADLKTMCVKFPPDDYALLEACADAERLKRSDIVRRAVRAYAETLGVHESGKPRRRQRRKRK